MPKTIHYNPTELYSLLSLWAKGTLDDRVAKGNIVAGVNDCVHTSQGIRGMSLIERFSIADVNQGIQAMYICPQKKFHACILIYVFGIGRTIEDLGRAINLSCCESQSLLIEAQDRLIVELLGAQD